MNRVGELPITMLCREPAPAPSPVPARVVDRETFAQLQLLVAERDALQARLDSVTQPVQPAPAKPTATAIELFKLVLAHVAAYKAALKDPYDETAEPRQAFRRAHDALHSAINDLTVEVETLRAITQPVQPDAELECTRSHPHENMDALCKLRTVIARLENEKAAQPAPTARVPLSDQEIKITSADIERLAEQAGLLLAGSDFVSNRDQTRAAVAFVKLLDAAIATKGAKT